MNPLEKLRATFIVWLLLVLFLCVSPKSVAQIRGEYTPTRAHNCEGALAILDMTLIEGQKDKESRFIVSAHLGDSEGSQRLNRKRLRDVMSYFRQKGESRVVLASGERVKGLGRLELYVSGKLLHLLAFPKNGFIDCRGL
jgi:hypothetical protein